MRPSLIDGWCADCLRHMENRWSQALAPSPVAERDPDQVESQLRHMSHGAPRVERTLADRISPD